MTIAIIGGGNMGSALASGLQNKWREELHNIIVSDPNVEKLEKLKDLNVEVTQDNAHAACGADVVVTAVKPQDMPRLLEDIKECLNRDVLVISIAAGFPINKMQKILDHKLVVRVMPNTPALIGQGISGWVAAKEVSDDQKIIVREILSAVGDEIELTDEDQIDMVTAMSGSGPAYVFYFLESFIEAGEEIGLPRDTAKKLAFKTLLGATKLAEINIDNLFEMRQKVTSKGGTTEAALKVLIKKEFKEIFKEAVLSAYKRAKELGKE